MMIDTATQGPRPIWAKRTPDSLTGYAYHTAWFADIRNERAHACDCQDYFHRNIWSGNPNHLCRHLRDLTTDALSAIHSAVRQAREGSVDEIANVLGIPRRPMHPFSAVYSNGKLDFRATAQAGRRENISVLL